MLRSGCVFGFSLSELVVVVIVALVVIGPKDLPKMLKKAGQWAGKIRRMASDLRAQSGIDDALRTEGLTDDINEIRKLARGELDAVKRADDPSEALSGLAGAAAPSLAAYSRNDRDPGADDFYVVRDREYPREGSDGYNSLPDNAIVYAQGLPKSPLASDPLYVTGDPTGIIPPDPPNEFYTGEDDGEAANGDGDGDATAARDDASDAETQPLAFGAPSDAEATPKKEAAKSETSDGKDAKEASTPSRTTERGAPADAGAPAEAGEERKGDDRPASEAR